ncbi:hypothetical protein QBC47DRAFT_142073 [Echria macrotheca]|uniref:F-box domain-containing protein n=1 Tax=Echria macrotheca TaxID=438768 RepID=A0AAJ0BI80_9PEZI|nr:hypothetical protein QBC47DRAFT_142073 [Echria macrotheca]
MALTPIKVKGKGPRKKWQPPSQARKLEIRKREAALHPEKRMHKRRRKEAPKGGAPVERLPLEILERIFFFSENLNLPRCSLRLGLALSTSGTLRELIITAFAPTWDLWLGCAQNDVRSYAGWRVDSERFGGDPKFQSAVLDCKWITVEKILDAQRLWIRRHGEGRVYDIVGPRAEGFPGKTTYTITSEHLRMDPADPRVFFDLQWEVLGQAVQDVFDELSENPELWSGEMVERDRFVGRPVTPGASMEMNPGVQIPERLLWGPLDWGDLKLLLWLALQGAKPAKDSWEITTRHMKLLKHKPPSPKLKVTTILLFDKLGVYVYPPYTHLSSEGHKHIDPRLHTHTYMREKRKQQKKKN